MTTAAPSRTTKRHKLRVNLDLLYDAMLDEAHGGGFGRFTRHKVRHKRRRPRQAGSELPWRFHTGSRVMNVAVYDENVPWDVIEGTGRGETLVNGSAVSENTSAGASAGAEVNGTRDVSPPMTLRQPQDEDEVMSEGKHCAL